METYPQAGLRARQEEVPCLPRRRNRSSPSQLRRIDPARREDRQACIPVRHMSSHYRTRSTTRKDYAARSKRTSRSSGALSTNSSRTGTTTEEIQFLLQVWNSFCAERENALWPLRSRTIAQATISAMRQVWSLASEEYSHVQTVSRQTRQGESKKGRCNSTVECLPYKQMVASSTLASGNERGLWRQLVTSRLKKPTAKAAMIGTVERTLITEGYALMDEASGLSTKSRQCLPLYPGAD